MILPADEIERLTRLLRDREAEIARMRTPATSAEALTTHLRSLRCPKSSRRIFAIITAQGAPARPDGASAGDRSDGGGG